MNFKSSLFWTTLAISAFICVAALGPALFNANLSWGEWYASWQRQAFSGLCHQQTDRMFLLNGMPMAVCSRCLGIYSAFFCRYCSAAFFTSTPLAQFLNNTVIICFGSPEHCRCTHVCAFSLGQHLVFPVCSGFLTRTHDCDFTWHKKSTTTF